MVVVDVPTKQRKCIHHDNGQNTGLSFGCPGCLRPGQPGQRKS